MEGVVSDLPLIEAEVDDLFDEVGGPPDGGAVGGPVGVVLF